MRFPFGYQGRHFRKCRRKHFVGKPRRTISGKISDAADSTVPQENLWYRYLLNSNLGNYGTRCLAPLLGGLLN
jgi:hypothetical protein